MSKSDPNDSSRINILDRPEATNLINIYMAMLPYRSKDEILQEVRDWSWGEFKPKLADAIFVYLEPMQQRYHQVRADDENLQTVLRDGVLRERITLPAKHCVPLVWPWGFRCRLIIRRYDHKDCPIFALLRVS